MKKPHVVAILATYNEERFIEACIEHLIRQGLEVYMLDNESTDDTVAIAERYRHHGLIDIETMPRAGIYTWGTILERKQELAAVLNADWFMHVDADEIRLPPPGLGSLVEAFGRVAASGYNAVNFQEFTFIPTLETPDHDHPEFQRTMRRYYPFLPQHPNRMNAWQRQDGPVNLADSGGHRVSFPNLRLYPEPFPMRHYLFLSVPHAIHKYVERRYDPAEVAQGWHGWRARLRPEWIKLPRSAELRYYVADAHLDASNPLTRHLLFDPQWLAQLGLK